MQVWYVILMAVIQWGREYDRETKVNPGKILGCY